MMNIIRSDLYRIVRGKALYITFAVLLALNVLVVTTTSAGTVGVNLDNLETSLGGITEDSFDGLFILPTLYKSMDNLVFFLLPLFILVASPSFSHSTIKNELSCGMSRTKLYLSKLTLSALLCLCLAVFRRAYIICPSKRLPR